MLAYFRLTVTLVTVDRSRLGKKAFKANIVITFSPANGILFLPLLRKLDTNANESYRE